MKKDEKSVGSEYAQAVDGYEKARDRLEEVLNRLQNSGVYPSAVAATRFRLPAERSGLTHAVRFRIPVERSSVPTERFRIPIEEDIRIFIQTGSYDDGNLGEVFLKADKQGTLVSGLMDALSIILSITLQYGVPIERIVDKLRGTQFAREARVVGTVPVRNCTSIVDYIVRWLELKYLPAKGDQNA